MHTKREFNMCGGRHSTATPIAALDAIAVAEPRLAVLLTRLAEQTQTLRELRTVLDAVCKAGGNGLSADQIIEHEGLVRAAEIAWEALFAAFQSPEDRAGNGSAGSEVTA